MWGGCPRRGRRLGVGLGPKRAAVSVSEHTEGAAFCEVGGAHVGRVRPMGQAAGCGAWPKACCCVCV